MSALGELIAPEHLQLLLDSLQQENFYLQSNILILLRKIHDAQCLPAIAKFFKSENPELREAAVTTLSYLNQVQRCPPVLKLMQDSDGSVRRATALTLGHLADEEAIALLTQALTTDPDWQVRRNAAKSIFIHAKPSIILLSKST
ncbi:MAG: hypothetical protein CLLPBCKN_003052 [Chroococcidiopsis cubana SAG 39.79]|nr:hypothetical protein [Chroococcidiopsis cubana SAG 39.79]